MQIRFNFNNPLPEEYEKEMPLNLTAIERYEWREHKLKELQIAGLVRIDDNGNCHFVTNDASITETPAFGFDISDNETDEDVVDESEEIFEVRKKPIQRQKTVSKSRVTKQASKAEKDVEFVNSIPKVVMDALRRLFPVSASKADLISAVIYIVTNGDCQISDKAMELVEQYNSDDRLTSINERLAHLESATKRQIELLQSIELCTCYNTFDRRYGSNEPRRAPKLTEFREKDNLDMLERLREQARDQLNLDNQTKGRQIYEQIKDKYD